MTRMNESKFSFSNFLLKNFITCWVDWFWFFFNQIVLLRLKHVECLEAFLFSVRTSVNMIQPLLNADMCSANLISPEMKLDAQKQ